MFRLSLPQFQIASCLDTNSLDYCDLRNNSMIKRASSLQTGTQGNGADSVMSPSSSSPPIQELQPNTFKGLSPLMPASINDLLLQDAFLTALRDQNQCDDMFVVCTATQIKPSTPPIGYPIWSASSPDLSDYVSPYQTVYYVNDPEPMLNPIPSSIHPLLATSTPEISTEIMTIIGFVTMYISCNRKACRSTWQVFARMAFKIFQNYIRRYVTQRPVV